MRGGSDTDLAIDELEEVERDVVELIVDGADDGLDRPLHRLDAGLQRARALLCVLVQLRHAHHRLQCRHMHELQVPQPLLLLLRSLEIQFPTTHQQNKTLKFPRVIKRNQIGAEFSQSDRVGH